LKIRDVMAREVDTVAAEATVEAAAQIMAELDVVVLPVVEFDALVGMLTERDITVRVVAAGRPPASTKVAEVMSSDVFSCRPDDDANAVEKEIRERKVRQIPVVGEDSKLVGIVTLAALRQEPPSGDDADAPRTPVEAETR
jgi:CBS domain-containing protein